MTRAVVLGGADASSAAPLIDLAQPLVAPSTVTRILRRHDLLKWQKHSIDRLSHATTGRKAIGKPDRRRSDSYSHIRSLCSYPGETVFVKLLARLVHHFYVIEKKSSMKQLQDDFREFPPAPLRCERLTGEFNVIRVRGMGELYHEFQVRRALLRATVADVQSLSSDFATAFGANEILAFQRDIAKLGRGSKVAERLLVFLGLGWMLVRAAIQHVRGPRRRILGHFVPFLTGTSDIVVKSGRHVHKSDASTVSHEHIHLLQFRNPENHCRNARSPERFLCEKMVAEPHLLYILEKKEVEARLHEIVLSFYRAHRQLPVTVPGFLGLLAASEQCGELVALILKRSSVTFEHYGIYSTRDTMYVDQLESIWVFIETKELQCKFITEVLTVMYGNLLRYYGDDAARRNYVKEIERPNFYDDLYKEE